VAVPIRADGECPREGSSERFEDQDCNTHACVGDEVCIAEQDLVIAVDGSGSVSEESWKMVVNFTGQILERYQADYYGMEKMRIGAVQFGNGEVDAEGKVSKAIKIGEITSDLKTLKADVAKMKHLQGFTNLAQAFSMAEVLLTREGRKTAQAAVMTITDGKPSFLFETKEKAKALEEGGIMKYMIGIAEFKNSEEWLLLEHLATQPAHTNTVNVPGFDALSDGATPFVQEAISKFCPQAHSPSMTMDVADRRGFMLVKEEGYCGSLGDPLGRDVFDPDQCFRMAQKAGFSAFSMGRKYRHGSCYIEEEQFSCDEYAKWREEPDKPKCSSHNGVFANSKYYDWYAIEPNCAT
jgi:hypothetical protein